MARWNATHVTVRVELCVHAKFQVPGGKGLNFAGKDILSEYFCPH